MNEDAVPKNTKMATKFDVTAFNGKLFNLSSLIVRRKIKTMPCLQILSSTKITMKTAWFQQEEFNSTTEEMTP